MWIHLQQARLLPTEQRIEWLSNMEIGILMSCPHTLAGFCIKTHQSLQKYEKTERHMLVCTDCPQPPLVRASRSQEQCARKCRKVKKNFTCRWVAFFVLCFPEIQDMVSSWPCSPHSSSPAVWTQYLHIFVVYHLFISQLLPVCSCRAFNFQRHNRKCHLLPFDRFTQGVQRQANVNFTLYEKKGKWCNFHSVEVDFMHSAVFLMRTIRCWEGLRRLPGFQVVWFFCWHNKSCQPTQPPPCLITPVRRVACINMLADLSGV